MAEVVSRRSIVYDILFDVESGKKSAKDAQAALGKLGTEFDKVTTEVENFSAQTLNSVARLRALKQQINNFKGTEAEFVKLNLEAAKLTDQLNKTNDRIRILASSTKNIDALAQGFQGIVSVFTAAQGAAALFGSENKNLQQAILKTQGALALLQGTQQAVRLITEQSAVKTVLLTNVQKAYNIVVGTSTGLMKGFRIALASTGIGLAVFGIIELAKAFGAFSDNVETATDKTKELNDELSEFNTLTGEANIVLRKYGLQQKGVNDVLAMLEKKQSLATLSTGLLEQAVSELNDEIKNKSVEDFAITLVGDTTTASQRFKQFTDETLSNIERIKTELARRTEDNNITLTPFRLGNVEDTDEQMDILKDRVLNSFGQLQKELQEAQENLQFVPDDEFESAKARIAILTNLLKQYTEVAKLTDTPTQSIGNSLLVMAETAGIAANALGNIGSAFGNLATLAKEGSATQLALAEFQVLVSTAAAIAQAIQGAAAAGAATGAAAPFTTPAFITSMVAIVSGALAQTATIISQAKAKQAEIGSGNANASAFAEGEIDIHRPGERKGKDSIPAVLMPGESVMTTAETATYKPILEAIRAGTLDDLIHQNYVAPELAVNALEHAKNDSREERDYSERFYKQLLATGEGNGINKRALNHLQSIDRKLTGVDFTKKYRR